MHECGTFAEVGKPILIHRWWKLELPLGFTLELYICVGFDKYTMTSSPYYGVTQTLITAPQIFHAPPIHLTPIPNPWQPLTFHDLHSLAFLEWHVKIIQCAAFQTGFFRLLWSVFYVIPYLGSSLFKISILVYMYIFKVMHRPFLSPICWG
jgi:hypothetical protein